MNLTLVIASLASGGSERVLSTLARAFQERGHHVSLITLSDKDSDFYPLPAAIRRVPLNLASTPANALDGVRNNLHRIAALRSELLSHRPDVVISFGDRTNVLVLLAALGSGIPVIVSERTDSRMYSCGQPWEMLRRLLYPFSAKLVSNSQSVDRGFTWLRASKRTMIYNPMTFMDTASATPALQLTPNRKHILGAGRLSREKGFDMLIQAFIQIAGKHPDWDLTILGDGVDRTLLTAMIAKANLQDRIYLPGQFTEPFPIFRQGHLFVIPSRFEGFVNVMVEALACGLPVISFDCPGSPHEVLRQDIDGILVPPEDINALAAAMDRLMMNTAEREKLAKSSHAIDERFGLPKIVEQWESLLNLYTSHR